MPLADYLAKNYLSADTKSAKKRKRKAATADIEGLTIADDDPNDWARPGGQHGDSDSDNGPTILGGTGLTAGLNKPSKKAKWVKIGAAAPTDAAQAAADALLADAQAESAARAAQDDDAPAVVLDGGDDDDDAGPTELVGLQTGDQAAAALKRKQRAELRALQAQGLDPSGKAQETIYRDASGRIINVAMKRAELRAKAAEEERKAREEVESRQGDVQRREKEQRRRELDDAKGMGVARHADDEKLNDELRERERWNDPMAQSLATKKSKAKGGRSKGNGKTYQGAFEPNRYNIRPGWRWDGVDRGNGFERKWFAARNKAKDRAELEYAWQLDE